MTQDTLTRPDTEAAEAAGSRTRWLATLLAWDDIRAQLPDTPETYLQAVAALQRAKQDQHADRVLAEAVRRFPDNHDLAVRHANAAAQRGDWPEAAARWQWVATQFPGRPGAYVNAGRILRKELGQGEAAEALLELAAARFPHDADVWAEFAAVARERKDRVAAIRRYRVMRDRFPTRLDAYRWLAGLLRDEGRFEEADATLAEALDHFPDDEATLTDLAWLALSRKDPEEAVRRWEMVRAVNPGSRGSYWIAGSALLHELERYDEADALLAEGMARFPGHFETTLEHARVAERRGDWPEALRRWEAARQRFPDNAQVALWHGRARTLAQLDWVDGSADGGNAEPLPVHRSSAAGPATMPDTISEHRDFFMQFESLGVNCEFGVVQRHFGAEPLGLLRWVWIEPRSLRRALEGRFEGVGEPENTRAEVEPDTDEIYVHDMKFGFIMHTFKKRRELRGEDDKFLALMCRRLQYLRRKMLDDLAAAEKLYVYKYPRPVAEAEIIGIAEALRSYGPNTLLFARHADAEHPPGSVLQTGPGLLTGHLDTFGRIGYNWAVDEQTAQMWLHIAKAAHALWRPTGAAETRAA